MDKVAWRSDPEVEGVTNRGTHAYRDNRKRFVCAPTKNSLRFGLAKENNHSVSNKRHGQAHIVSPAIRSPGPARGPAEVAGKVLFRP